MVTVPKTVKKLGNCVSLFADLDSTSLSPGGISCSTATGQVKKNTLFSIESRRKVLSDRRKKDGCFNQAESDGPVSAAGLQMKRVV